MYVRVYAPDGEPFDVSRERADHLLLNCGWTQTQPVSEEPKTEDKSKQRRKKLADASHLQDEDR